MDRISIFVDGANTFYCQRDKLGWWIDWEKFLDYYRSKYDVVSASYYRAFKVPPTEEEIGFGVFLARNGYKLREKMLKVIVDKNTGESTVKGNLDVELAIDALTTIDRYDVCLLVSGDGDFQPLCRVLSQKGKIVRAVSTPGIVAAEIRAELGEDFDDLQDLQPYIERQKKSVDTVNRSARTKTPANVTSVSLNTLSLPPSPPTTISPPAPPMISKGQEFEGKVTKVFAQWAKLSNPWNVNMYINFSGLGVRGHVEDLRAILKDGDSLHAVVTEVDPSEAPWKAGAELRDSKTSAVLQTRIDASRPPPGPIPDSGEFALNISHVKEYGAFLKNPWNAKILLHARTLGLGFIDDCTKLLRVGDAVRIRVTNKEVGGDDTRVNVELSGNEYREELQRRLKSITPEGQTPK
ncbi:MAG: NYN domain-containing protein [Planctomycetota bacterium]